MPLISLKFEVGERFSSRLHSGVPLARVAAGTERTGGDMVDEDGAVEWVKPEWWHEGFDGFEDWLIDGPAGKWPDPPGSEKLVPWQTDIITRHGQLLNGKDGGEKWQSLVQKFIEAVDRVDPAAEADCRRSFRIHFDRHNFGNSERKNFDNFVFPCSVSFFSADFGQGYKTFRHASFVDGDVWFNRARFGSGNLAFDNAQFGNGKVCFEKALFSSQVISFVGVHFGDGDVCFEVAHFLGNGQLDFSEAKFGNGLVSFEGAIAEKGDGVFNLVNFGDGELSFRKASFSGGLSLENASFGKGGLYLEKLTVLDGDVLLLSKTRLDFAVASQMKIGGSIYVRADFQKTADFSQLTVGGNASFAGSTFAEIPDFTDAKFDRPPDVAGMEVSRPKLTWLGMAAEPKDVLKLRKLKAMALSVHDHEKDGDFFAA